MLTENAAILQFIADAYPAAGLAPPESDRSGAGEAAPMAELHRNRTAQGADDCRCSGARRRRRSRPGRSRKYASRLAYLDDKLKGREFLLDRFSVADAYLATVLNWTQATPEIDLAAYPNVKAYLERMRQRPSVAAALRVEVPLFRAEIARRKAA